MSTEPTTAGRRDPFEGIDADGTIVTGASRTAVPAEFEPALTDAVEAAPAGVAVYLYGSVATGQAALGASDVDLLTIGLSATAATELSARLSPRYADRCRGVEIAAGQPPDFVGDHDEAYGNRAFVRHYCVHLAGPALPLEPPFPADRRAARGFNGDIGSHAHRWRLELPTREPAELARIVARKTLLAVSGLVSVHDRTWTTHRGDAARRWAEIDPSSAAGMQQLLGWTKSALGATRTELGDLLDTTVPVVVERFEHDIGLWDAGLPNPS